MTNSRSAEKRIKKEKTNFSCCVFVVFTCALCACLQSVRNGDRNKGRGGKTLITNAYINTVCF